MTIIIKRDLINGYIKKHKALNQCEAQLNTAVIRHRPRLVQAYKWCRVCAAYMYNVVM